MTALTPLNSLLSLRRGTDTEDWVGGAPLFFLVFLKSFHRDLQSVACRGRAPLIHHSMGLVHLAAILDPFWF